MRNVKVHTSSPTTTTTTMIMIRTIFNGYNYGNIPVRTIQMDRVGTHVDGVIAMFAKIIKKVRGHAAMSTIEHVDTRPSQRRLNK